MKAVISTTLDDKYLFYLPITIWCWNKLGIGVVNCIPGPSSRWSRVAYTSTHYDGSQIASLVIDTLYIQKLKWSSEIFYSAIHKEATYAQVARLFACARPGLEPEEVLITSDVDMLVFKNIFEDVPDGFHVTGIDLVPQGQIPMCYVAASVKTWNKYFNPENKTYQQLLDEHVGSIECTDFRGNLWSRDQELLHNGISNFSSVIFNYRAYPGTQFAQNRVDRDDGMWRENIKPGLIDYHCHRPGYTDENFPKILEVIQGMYPYEDLTWMREYRNKYISLINE